MSQYTFSKEFQKEKYESCLKEIGAAIEQLRIQSECSVKFLMPVVHIGFEKLAKGVCKDKLSTFYTTSA